MQTSFPDWYSLTFLPDHSSLEKLLHVDELAKKGDPEELNPASLAAYSLPEGLYDLDLCLERTKRSWHREV